MTDINKREDKSGVAVYIQTATGSGIYTEVVGPEGFREGVGQEYKGTFATQEEAEAYIEKYMDSL